VEWARFLDRTIALKLVPACAAAAPDYNDVDGGEKLVLAVG
jgi:hypothetical protein